jgi:hypothetical protein
LRACDERDSFYYRKKTDFVSTFPDYGRIGFVIYNTVSSSVRDARIHRQTSRNAQETILVKGDLAVFRLRNPHRSVCFGFRDKAMITQPADDPLALE